jgi:glycine cleavage system transcriptional repressor
VKKIVVFVLGPDRPGIIAAVSETLYRQQCNLEDVTHTTLQSEFVGIFLASVQDGAREEDLYFALQGSLSSMRLFVHLRPLDEQEAYAPPPSEPFVITTVGPDRPGLVAGITAVLARFGVNISNMKAVPRGGPDHAEYLMFYEVDVPTAVDHRAFREALSARAAELGMDLNLQHREIFEQVHRV